MKTFLHNFRKLGWKLTFSYTLVTVTAVLVLEALALGVGLILVGRPQTFDLIITEMAVDMADSSQHLFGRGEPDPQAASAWLSVIMPDVREQDSLLLQLGLRPQNTPAPAPSSPADTDLVVITGPDGAFLGANAPEDLPLTAGAVFVDPYAAESQTVLEAARAGQVSTLRTAQGTWISAAPIRDDEQQVRGVLYVRMVSFNLPAYSWEIFKGFLSLLAVTGLVFTLGAGMIGTIFGFFTARGLSQRLGQVAGAAGSWSRGDFSAFIHDRSEDELGQLSQRLNTMAEQLQNLLYARQELAALEERNRLARDLHDSVKQQVFATAMQVGAARALLESDPHSAALRLEQAEALARQAQAELTGLIRELRPAALEGRGLAAALREYAQEWSHNHNTPVEISVQGERPLPLETEQALFRVVQEGLANIARHSGARQVSMALHWTTQGLELTLADDGCGFIPGEGLNPGIGLHSMRERVEALGGKFRVESAPGAGARIEVWAPAPRS